MTAMMQCNPDAKRPGGIIRYVKGPGKVKMQTATSKCRQALLPTVSAPDSTIVYDTGSVGLHNLRVASCKHNFHHKCMTHTNACMDVFSFLGA